MCLADVGLEFGVAACQRKVFILLGEALLKILARKVVLGILVVHQQQIPCPARCRHLFDGPVGRAAVWAEVNLLASVYDSPEPVLATR